MRIAIIGGGIAGLTAAYELVKAGHEVTVFEKEKQLGGLAAGFKGKDWKWPLEKFYHHFFTNDFALIKLARELGLEDKLIIRRPITANYISPSNYELKTNIRIKTLAQKYSHIRTNSLFVDVYQFDSPAHLLCFPYLSPIDKLRTGLLLVLLKINPFWRPLENISAEQLFTAVGGKRAWQTLWEPLMTGKFNGYSSQVAASWLWARIKKRTPRLGYIKGGFQTLIDALAKAVILRGGKILLNSDVVSISNIKSQISNIQIEYKKSKTNSSFACSGSFRKDICHLSFNRALLTVPSPIALKIVPQLKIRNLKFEINVPHLHAQTLILETKKPILKDVYWLNITDRSFPFLAVVAHTNFIDKKYYGGHHLTYLGNYLPDNHPYLKMNAKKLYEVFAPYIKLLNPSFHSSFIIHHSSFIGFHAQPVHRLHYSQIAPKLETPVKDVYLANLDSIYPWDRGVNYAIELGIKAAQRLK